MRVEKRNGTFENVSFDKVLRRIEKLSTDLKAVDPSEIAKEVCSKICDGVTTSELDEVAAKHSMTLLVTDPEFGVLGSRIIISNNQKNTPDFFSECVRILAEKRIIHKDVASFVEENKEELDFAIDHERDYDFSFFSFKTLEKSYLKKVDGKTVESIQYMFMRVSCGIHYPDVKEVIRSYNLMSKRFFTHATPTLFNSGTISPQLLSCFLTAPDDSIEGMYDWKKKLALISKRAGGIGGSISNIRSEGAYIRGTDGVSNGIVPMLRGVQATMKHVNQGGRRPGSAAIYLEPHHPDIARFLELRLNQGNEDDRCRDTFTAIWASDLFMERVQSGSEWTLMDPDECPGLDLCYGDEYRRLYEKYESEGRGCKTVMAHDIWKAITVSQIETGTPYVLFKDSVNNKSNHQNLGTIRGSNLCAEICEYHDEKEYACCCLTSVCLSMFVDEKNNGYNFDMLGDVTAQCVRNLNKVIERNMYPVPETKMSNFRHRPLGIGVQGLADTFYKLRIPFERYAKVSPEADKLNKDIFETMYYYGMKESVEEAKKYGPYSTFRGSPLSEGKFQFDMWGVKPSDRYDWESLRSDVMRYGVRNSLLFACMPTASTSQIMGCEACIEPMTSNIYARSTMAGVFVNVNEYMVKDLQKIGMWNKNIKDEIIANDGSIQLITGIPQDIKDMYKTVWEMKQKTLMDLSIGRGPYICQTQSLNLFFEEPTTRILTKALFYAWKKGLKTGCYYIHSLQNSKTQKFTIDPSLEKKIKETTELKKKDKTKDYTKDGLRIVCTKDICVSCSG